MRLFLTGSKKNIKFLSGYLKEFPEVEILTSNGKNINFFRNIINSDITHIISIKPNGLAGMFWIILFLITKLLNKKILLHWQGTDVTELNKINGLIFSKILSTQTVQSEWLCNELEEKYIKAKLNTIVPPLPKRVYPLPEKFSILVYLGTTEGRENFYGLSVLKILITKFQNIDFYVIGKFRVKEKNVKILEQFDYSEVDKIYSKITLLLRVTKHDGLSFMVLEALARGRYVIWNKKFHECMYADNTEDLILIIENLSSIKLEVNVDGKKYVEKNLSPKYCVDKTLKLYKKVLNKSCM